ncbi:putative cell division control protein Cdc25 [Aspergillus campestris IBT 28561]|uniref:Cell division control protein Cdc25 n=1 Tax=Aspergillus campestris (strain IBT 28561) TaxID=1392248 RepID=A0A2I1D6P0_ASPC2|nr:putative cell division control protein Cdc25 [Aspergillus campestris IBT 28561]PKY05546.1 putative cell division control protein Cdc25 [Aspergillus campestris IBT 28561]
MVLTTGGRYTPSPEPASALFVRAMYDYDADDPTSLSFRRGDVIQVLNQLETGWWDGVINNNIRGWFPSNYCAVIDDPSELQDHIPLDLHEMGDGHASADSGAGEAYDDGHDDDEVDSVGNPRDSAPILPIEGTVAPKEQEEAAFWIPQATPDGRLFYFNTLTGYSTMELPFENPAANETGPYDRNNFFVPDQTRPPPELMARGFERDEDEYDGSASEAEGESLMVASHDSMSRRRQSFMDGVSPATSMDSLHPPSTMAKATGHHSNRSQPKIYASHGPSNSTTSLSETYHRPSVSSEVPSHFVDDAASTPLTWPLLVDNMHHAIEAYRQTLLSGDRSEYVRKAEDISDHLRMLLAAGSDTTDNHSGNPSIISTNKALYPHFRDMMSKFSKLVLSSHIAAADWPGPDSAHKCLQEADGVMHGVYGYVDVARKQRGEAIHRVVPGFVMGSFAGGCWQSNGVSLNGSGPTSFLDQDPEDSRAEPSTPLDLAVLDHIDVLRKALVGSIRRLEERLTLNQKKIVTAMTHREIGDSVSAAAIKVVEQYRPWVSAVESVNLAPLGTSFQNPQLVDYGLQKQRVYDAIGDFVLSCQAIAAPLGDEWAELRGDSLDDRLNAVRGVARQLENYVSQIGFSLSLLLEQIPEPATVLRSDSRLGDTPEGSKAQHGRGESKSGNGPMGLPSSFSPEPPSDKVRRNMNKAQRFFGQAPPTAITREPIREPVREPEETPWYLKMDHEGEVFYDTKNDVPTLKCGTLGGLVEHLTRHDKLDASFNNTFLLTYRSFTTASELFEMLTQRFNIQPPFGLNPDEMQMWVDRKQKPIRFRVVNILKSWFEHFWMEPSDETNMQLLDRVHSFTRDSIATTKTPGSPQLLTVVEQRIRGQDTTAKRLVPTQATAAPTPIIPKNMKKLKFLDIDPTEFARQLTIIESRLYSKIRPTECLNKTWQKKVAPGEPEPASNVKALILHSNQLTNWVAEMILVQSDVKKQISRLEALKEQRAPTLQLIERHRSLITERDALATSSQDASRLMARGVKGERRDPGKLLREEKMRKRIAKELPKVEADLRKELELWEDEFGRPFLVHGERYLDDLTPVIAKPPPRSKSAASGSVRGSAQKAQPPARPASVMRAPPPPRSATKTPTGHSSTTKYNTIGPSRGGAKSPSKIPSRVPLGNIPHANNSPDRRGGPGTYSSSTMNAKTRAPPPRMRALTGADSKDNSYLFEPPRCASALSSSTFVRPVSPEDVYDDRNQRSFMSSSIFSQRSAGQSSHSSASSLSLNSTQAFPRPNPYLQNKPPPPAPRQVSNSSTIDTANGGSENWETFDDGSESEADASDVYYAKVRAAHGKRLAPEDQQGLSLAGKKARGIRSVSPDGPQASRSGNIMRVASGEWTDEMESY